MKTVFKIFVMAIVTLALTCTLTACFFREHTHTASTDFLVSKEATCVSPGEKYMYCVDCGEKLNTVVVPATGNHNYQTVPGYAATCSTTGLTDGEKCKDCDSVKTAQTVIPKNNNHTTVKVPGYVATCSTTGLTDGEKCKDCGVMTVAQTTISTNNNHVNTEVIPGYTATCSTTGLTDGAKCKDCNKVVTEQQVIDKNDVHTDTEVVPGYAATCSITGLTDGEKCKACGVMTVERTTIPTNDVHAEVETVVGYAATCSTTGLTDGEKCKACGVMTVAQTDIPTNDNHVVVDIPMVAPTCSKIGWTAGTKCNLCQTVIKAPVEIPVSTHTPGEWTVESESTYATPGVRNLICTTCDKILDTEITPPITTEGLAFELNENGTGYVLTGRGTADKYYINIPGEYEGLPVVGIADNAFADDKYILTIFIPENVTYIGESAFAYCYNVEMITMPSTLVTIGDNAFIACQCVEKITIPENVRDIGSNAFNSCGALTTLVVKSVDITVGSAIFGNCTSLTTIELMSASTWNLNDFTNPETLPLAGCYAFTTLNFIDEAWPNMYESNILTEIAKMCNALNLGYYDGDCVYLGTSDNAYRYLINVVNKYSASYAINENVEYIGPNAFEGCCLTAELYVPANVMYIDENALTNMECLQKITFYNTLKHVATNAMTGTRPETVMFNGTEDQWNNLQLADYFLTYYNNIYYLNN